MSPFGQAPGYGLITPPDQGWLQTALAEDIIEPDLPIIDPHHHLWDNPRHRYLVPEFAADLATGHRVLATVYMNCWIMYRSGGPAEMQPVGEVEFANGQAAMSASGQYGPTHIAAGIVGTCDANLGDRVEPVIATLIAAGNGRLRGVRVSGGWDEDRSISSPAQAPGLYDRADVRAALRVVQRAGLSFDALVFHPQLRDVVNLARALPDLKIVLNHMGQPLGFGRHSDRRAGFEIWRGLMREVALCPNVTVKLGGILLRLALPDHVARGARPPTSEELAILWRPWIETTIAAFGPDRCMFESNFPVEKMGLGYAALWNAFKRMATDYSSAEKAALFSGTAARVYRLQDVVAQAVERAA